MFALWPSFEHIWAMPSMRHCLLLPVKDELDGELAFKVFETVEEYLKESDWCFYKSNSEILSILSNHRNNLNDVLEDKKVLRIVSEKTQAGSLIRIKIINRLQGINLKMKVFGASGEDIFFQRETELESEVAIDQTLKMWLGAYEKKIPYDAIIVGMLGNQLTIDMGTIRGLHPGMKVKLIRPEGKKNHPLLKQIVSWETKDLAQARIFHSEATQSIAKIAENYGRDWPKVGDWVVLEGERPAVIVQEGPESFRPDNNDPYRFGKLGTLGIFFDIGKNSATSENSSTPRRMSGPLLGAAFDGEVWIMRNYWATFEVTRGISTLDAENGGSDENSNQASTSKFGFKIGYRYLPLNFFYGPRLDASIGYVKYNFGLDTSRENGFTEVGFKGVSAGIKGSLPLANSFRFGLGLNFILNPKYSEKVSLYGEPASTSLYNITLGGSYAYHPSMTFDFAYGVTVAKAHFGEESQRGIEFKESKLKTGITFTF